MNQKFLLLALSAFVISSCEDDDEKFKDQFTIDDQTTHISSGIFMYDTTPQEDDDENTFYRNRLFFVDKGLSITVTGDPTYSISGAGNMLELWITNDVQELEAGEYTWQEAEHEQPFDLWAGELTLNKNSDGGLDEEYELQSGTLTVTKSGNNYTISFSGTAASASSGSLAVSAQFKGKLTHVGFNFQNPA